MTNLRLISTAGRELDLEASVEGVLEKVLVWTERIFRLQACAVLLRDESDGTLRIRAARGYEDGVVQAFRGCPGRGVTGRAFEERRLVRVCDVRRLPGYVPGVPGATCEMAAPLVVQGEVLGVLDAEARRKRAFSSAEAELFDLFAAHVASALHNARLVEQARADSARLRMRARDLCALNEVGMRIATFTDLDSLIQGAMDLARRSLFFRSCALLMRDGDDLVVRAAYGYGERMREGQRLPRGTGIAWRAVVAAVPVLVTDVASDPDAVLGLLDARCQMAAPLLSPAGPVGVLVAESPKVDAFNPTSLELFATFAHQVSAALENARLHETNKRTFYETIRALAQALEMRDSYTRGHSDRVTAYGRRIGEALGLPGPLAEVLEQAGLLHDIGKIGVRDAVLLKAGALDAVEREAIERHPVIGDSILHPVGFLREALEAVLHHHEHFDGCGYPSRLKGEEIPIVARVISVADAYDAMTSTRPYRSAMAHEDAVAEIVRRSGTQFDPDVVAAFLATIGGMGGVSCGAEAPDAAERIFVAEA